MSYSSSSFFWSCFLAFWPPWAKSNPDHSGSRTLSGSLIDLLTRPVGQGSSDVVVTGRCQRYGGKAEDRPNMPKLNVQGWSRMIKDADVVKGCIASLKSFQCVRLISCTPDSSSSEARLGALEDDEAVLAGRCRSCVTDITAISFFTNGMDVQVWFSKGSVAWRLWSDVEFGLSVNLIDV